MTAVVREFKNFITLAVRNVNFGVIENNPYKLIDNLEIKDKNSL